MQSSSTDINRYLNDYHSLGANWIRFDFDWAYIQADGPTSYNWAANDAAVASAQARGIKVLGIIAYVPQWALPSGCTDSYRCAPKNASDFAAFAAKVAARYAPMGVHTWEIWNEPNLSGKFTAPTYTALLQATYTAIKQVDPTAFILNGGLGPAVTNGTDISPCDFLAGIYQSGGKGSFEAIAHHPYCFHAGFAFPFYQDWSAWSQMQDTPTSLRSIMIANGDQSKQIWATEFGAPSGGSSNAMSEADQALLVKNAYHLFHSYAWSGPLFWYTYKDPCTTPTSEECYFGLVRSDYSHKSAYRAYQRI